MYSTLIRSLQVVFLLGLTDSVVIADQQVDRDFIKHEQAKEQLLQHLTAPLVKGVNGQPFDQGWINQLVEKQQSALGDQSRQRETPEVVYFVSSSIPVEGMRQILRDADRLGIPAAMRGLINNDFRNTAAFIMELAQPDNKGGVQIDPTLFKQFGVQSVPALVVTCNAGFDKVGGNVKLERALKIIAEDGDCKEVAARYLGGRS